MGRQVEFHALAADLGEFLDFVCTGNPVVVTLMDSDRPEIEPLVDPRSESRVMTLWNQAVIPTLERTLVPSGSYRIRYSLPVLALTPSRATSLNHQPALLRGRLYGFSFEGAPAGYAKWYDALARWIRSHFARSPLGKREGYIGRAALAWFQQGGILLPWPDAPATMTPELESYVDAQRAARAKLK